MNISQDCKYTGIGSRKTPQDIIYQMEDIAKYLCSSGYTLRSGGAQGADAAFERGADEACSRKEIFLPSDEIPDEAFEIAALHHPTWGGLPPFVKRLHSRNVQQVLGKNLDLQSKFVICWTPDGAESVTTKETGGTGQAIRIANAYNVPVYNLANEGRFDEIKDICDCALMQYSDYLS